MSGFENIIYEVERGRARITLNRPGEAQRAVAAAADRAQRGAVGGRQQPRGALRDHQGRRPRLLRRLRPHRRRHSQPGLARPVARQRVPRLLLDRRRRLAARADAAPAHGAVRHAQAVDRPGARLLPGGRHRRGAAVRHDRRGRGRPLRLSAGARSRRAPQQHVALPRRSAVGEAPDHDRRHRDRRGSAADRPGVEGGAEGAPGGRGRAARRSTRDDRSRSALRQQAHHQHGSRADGRPHAAADGGRERRARPQHRGGAHLGERVRANGLRETLRARDAKFGDGRARVDGPEIRDEDGRLVDDTVWESE